MEDALKDLGTEFQEIEKAAWETLAFIAEKSKEINSIRGNHSFPTMAKILSISLSNFITTVNECSEDVGFSNHKEQLLLSLKKVLEQIIIHRLSGESSMDKSVH
jgi:hypothetical protein